MDRSERALEEYLVASARLGEQAAMTRLVELRGPRLFVHAVRLLGDAEEARDCVQDAWVDIFRGLKGLRDTQAFPAWATRIVTRRCAGLIRTKQRHRVIAEGVAVEGEEAVQDSGPDAAEAVLVRRAIASLPPEQAAVIALFYLEDMSVGEVSLAMDVPRGTVKTRLMHARTKLKATLEGESYEQE